MVEAKRKQQSVTIAPASRSLLATLGACIDLLCPLLAALSALLPLSALRMHCASTLANSGREWRGCKWPSGCSMVSLSVSAPLTEEMGRSFSFISLQPSLISLAVSDFHARTCTRRLCQQWCSHICLLCGTRLVMSEDYRSVVPSTCVSAHFSLS